ncbi:hypothetical protein Pfo_001108 [Paulownia fortunei]|nr:hypothetical protein Pfo_001108 [Paulownia fortunei]
MLLSKKKLSPTSAGNSRNRMKGIQESHERKEEADEKGINIWDCGSPLYDSYELVAVSHVVERHFMILPYLSGSRKLATELCHSSSLISSSEKPAQDEAASSNAGKSSVLSFLSELVERNVWKRKRKRKMDGERKQEAKKQKTGISKIFPCRISSWKK